MAKKLSCGGKELAPARKKHGAQKNFLAWKRIGGSRVRSLAAAVRWFSRWAAKTRSLWF